MASNSDWQRVSKSRPCPICGKPDWCLFVGPADFPTAAICARVESEKRCGEAGWFHKLKDTGDCHRTRRRTVRTATKPNGRPIVDFGAYARQCHLATVPDALRRFGQSVGLSAESLRRLCVGWSARHRAWTFPMSDAADHIVGIRLRKPNGRKLAVRGGKEGLFLPADIDHGGRLLILICEGPTDTAALLDLGFRAVGRPSCTGGTRNLVELVKRLRPEEVVIVGDNDQPDRHGRRPGQDGADRLAANLAAYVPVVRMITPPNGIKHARAWKQAGATAANVQAAIDAALVRRLRIKTTMKGKKGCRAKTATG